MQGPNSTLGVYTFPPGASATSPRLVIDGVHGTITDFIRASGGNLISSVMTPEFSSKNGFTVTGTVNANASDQFQVPANDAKSPVGSSDATSYRIRAYGGVSFVGTVFGAFVLSLSSNNHGETVDLLANAANDEFLWTAEGLIQVTTTGAGGTANYYVSATVFDINTGTVTTNTLSASNSAFDTTALQVLGFTGSWANVSSGSSLLCTTTTYSRFGP